MRYYPGSLERINISCDQNRTTLKIPNIEVKHTGIYKLIVENGIEKNFQMILEVEGIHFFQTNKAIRNHEKSDDELMSEF